MLELVHSAVQDAGNPLVIYITIIASAGYLTKHVMIPLLKLR